MDEPSSSPVEAGEPDLVGVRFLLCAPQPRCSRPRSPEPGELAEREQAWVAPR